MKGIDLKNGNWGLKLLALVLAIVIYHMLKTQPADNGHKDHDRSLFQAR